MPRRGSSPAWDQLDAAGRRAVTRILERYAGVSAFERPYAVADLQARVRELRERGAPRAAIVLVLERLAELGGLQSWRDAVLLAEELLAQGQRARARRIATAALDELKGLPQVGPARAALRALLDRCPERRPARRPAPAAAARVAPPAPAPARDPVAAPGAATGAPAAAAAAPEPPDEAPLEVQVHVADCPDLTAALAGARDAGLGRRRLALLGHEVAVTDRFDHLLCLDSLHGVEQLPHQIETVKRVLRVLRGRALLADEVGLGKTIEAGLLLSECLQRALVETVLILVPAALVGQWREELAGKFGITVATTEDEAFRADPDAFFAREPRILASLELARGRRHCDRVAARAWDLVIVDEAHRLKRSATLGYQLVDRLRSRFLLLLTATPVENRLEELYNIVTLLRPGQLDTLAAFKRRFVQAGDPTAPRDADTLRALLAEVMVRNTRALVDLRLPPRFASTIRCEPTAGERALYGAITAATAAHYGTARDRLALATLMQTAGSSPRAARATAGRILERDPEPGLAALLAPVVAAAADGGATGKAPALLEVLTAAARAGEKTVVFTRFRETLAFLEELLEQGRVPHVSFSGAMSGPEKDAAVRALAAEVGVMLATEVGGEGRNLQCASVLVNYDLPWNPMRLEQRIGRLHRIGQTREVRIYNLCAAGSAEEHILEVLDRRINLFELVVGELDMILGHLEDERELGERILEIYGTAAAAGDVAAGFQRLGDELMAARARYERSKALDRALFARDYEV